MNVKQHRLRGLSLALVSSVALALAGAGVAGAQTPDSTAEVERLVESIHENRSITWHWQRVKGHRPTPSESLVGITDPERLAALDALWKRRADRRLTRAKNPPHEMAWRCIHRHEGPWDDPNAPYYGGLQMNKEFQRGYGRYLLASREPPTTGTPRSRCGSPSARSAPGRAFARGRTPPATAACSEPVAEGHARGQAPGMAAGVSGRPAGGERRTGL